MRFLIKKSFHLMLAIVLLLMMFSLCFAFEGKVSYPDGTPAVGAQVILTDSNDVEQTATCNKYGKFQFTKLPEGDAKIQINAPDGKNYAPVVLPAAVFGSGETAIVLQPK
jgi:hypothetical protein